MVTKKEMEDGWTNIRIRKDTLKRLRVMKAMEGDVMFDDTIDKSLDLLERKLK